MSNNRELDKLNKDIIQINKHLKSIDDDCNKNSKKDGSKSKSNI